MILILDRGYALAVRLLAGATTVAIHELLAVKALTIFLDIDFLAFDPWFSATHPLF